MQLRDDEQLFDKAGGRVVLVGMGSHRRADDFCREKHVEFECLADPRKEGYKAYGLERGKYRQIFNPKATAEYLASQTHPETRQRVARQDWRQMPGTFVIDSRGVVRFAHRNRDVSDNPANEPVLRALKEAGPRTGGRK